MSPSVNSSPNSASVVSMFSMVEMYSPPSIPCVGGSPPPAVTGGVAAEKHTRSKRRPQHPRPTAEVIAFRYNRKTTPEPRERRTFYVDKLIPHRFMPNTTPSCLTLITSFTNRPGGPRRPLIGPNRAVVVMRPAAIDQSQGRVHRGLIVRQPSEAPVLFE